MRRARASAKWMACMLSSTFMALKREPLKREARKRMAMSDDGSRVKLQLIERASQVQQGAEVEHLSFAAQVQKVMQRDCSGGAEACMNRKRKEEGAMEAREYHFYAEQEVNNRGLGEFKTCRPERTAAETRGKLPFFGWRDFFELTLDPALPLNDTPGEEFGCGYLRRWGCHCGGPGGCAERMQHPDSSIRYGPATACILLPLVGALNAYKRCVFERKLTEAAESDEEEDEIDANSSDSGDSCGINEALLDAAERLGERILPGSYFCFDAGGDPKAAGTPAIGRYYVARATTAVEVLEADQPSDWGVLPAGVKVVHAHYLNLVYVPEAKPRWY